MNNVISTMYNNSSHLPINENDLFTEWVLCKYIEGNWGVVPTHPPPPIKSIEVLERVELYLYSP